MFGRVYHMKERDTAIIPARVKKAKIELIRHRAAKKGMTVNAWLNWAIDNGLRKHHGKIIGN
jgi:predicted DNA binding CopG/RHH family protein